MQTSSDLTAAAELVDELQELAHEAAMMQRYKVALSIVAHCSVAERWQLLELVVFGSSAIDAAMKARSCPPDTDEALTASAAVDGRDDGEAPTPAAAKRRPARTRDWSWWGDAA